MKTFVCKNCGSDEIRLKAWVDINTYEYVDCVDEEKDTYCPHCKDFCKAIPEDQYDYMEDRNCGRCSGTGLGMYEGGSCTECHGRGYL